MEISKRKWTLIMYLFANTITCAQAISSQWVIPFNSLNGSAYDRIKSVVVDDSANTYVLGNYQNTIDFDPGPLIQNFNDDDLFILKLNSNGDIVWIKSIFINSDLSSGRDLDIDDSGNVYIAGVFHGTCDFDPGLQVVNKTANSWTDAFILKLDNNGNFIWVKHLEGTDYYATVNSIHFDSNSFLYIVGEISGDSIDFDPGVGTFYLDHIGGHDIYIAKFDINGDFIWAKSIASMQSEYANSVDTDSTGNIYLSGNFRDTVDFDPNSSIYNLSTDYGSGYILKLNSTGDFIWAQNIGVSPTSDDFSSKITVHNSEYIYLTGGFKDTVDFDPGPNVTNLISNGFFDIMILKFDVNGNFYWAKSAGAQLSDYGTSVITDDIGNIYVGTVTGGNANGPLDIDPSLDTFNIPLYGGVDSYVKKLDSNGNFIWGYSISAGGHDEITCIDVDEYGDNIYLGGSYCLNSDFDPSPGILNLPIPGSFTNSNMFIQKLYLCQSVSLIDTNEACESFEWIDGNMYYTNNNTATFTIPNVVDYGCDSIITLNLTINQSSDTIISITACDSLVSPSGNYTWTTSNTYIDTIPNAVGCDSLITIDLTINMVTDTTTSINGTIITANNSSANYLWLDCDNGNSPILGETNQSFISTVNGNYSVQLTENGCIDTTACVTITTVGTLENSFLENFVVYPNPTNDSFFINLGSSYEFTTIVIKDINGKVVQLNKYNNSQLLKLKLEEAAGVYLLVIESDDKRAVIRIVNK